MTSTSKPVLRPGETRPAFSAEQTSGTPVLPRGTRVQYRTVGRGVIEQHTCPETYPCWRFLGSGGAHQYAVKFETGRYRGTTRNCWVRNTEKLAD